MTFVNVVDHLYDTEFLEKLFKKEINITPIQFSELLNNELSWVFSVWKLRKMYSYHFKEAGFGDACLKRQDLDKIRKSRKNQRQ